ncbi:MAG: aromatic amino acid DMT transporter YddG [Symbiopectobacterium sp.]|uniref:aromatic amino acid DMT transporter YddG n=1 Tax=Symbiopectobacterium sp. TaxID=2952789 RepID=UPI0039E7E8AE
MTPQRAMLAGLLAILLWSTSVGLLRSLTEALGPVGGAAMIYSTCTLCLVLFSGIPTLRGFSKGYLFGGGLVCVCYEIFLSLSIGFADNRVQAMKMGMINYLWPSLTLLFAVFFNQQKSSIGLWVGVALALVGIIWMMKGESQWSPLVMWHNIQTNPLAYNLAFAAAISWALYCNITKCLGQGKSGNTLFFFVVSVVLWIQYAVSTTPTMTFSVITGLELLFMGASTAIAYSAWNTGIQRGNMTLLATASYFTPVFSTLLAALWLRTVPDLAFWQGVSMITLGSLVCWWATREAQKT